MIDINLALTTAGQALMAKIQTGSGTIPLNLTRIVTASGSDPNPLDLDDVIDEQQTLSITNATTDGERTTIKAIITNAGDPEQDIPPLEHGYLLSQIGFFATDLDEGEILFRISQFANPSYVPAASERSWTYEPTFNFVTGNASEVTIEINQAGIATMEYVDNAIADLAGSIDLEELTQGLNDAQTKLSGHIGAGGITQHPLATQLTPGFSERNFTAENKNDIDANRDLSMIMALAMNSSELEDISADDISNMISVQTSVQSGKITTVTGTAVAVTFERPFTSIPRILLSLGLTSTVMPFAANITVTGFTINRAAAANQPIYWIAIPDIERISPVIQSGIAAAGTAIAVTFAVPFASVPKISVTPGISSGSIWITNVTKTGFTLNRVTTSQQPTYWAAVTDDAPKNLIQSGTVTATGAALNITFERPFAVAPRISLAKGVNSAGVMWVSNVTAAGFTLNRATAADQPVYWTAWSGVL